MTGPFFILDLPWRERRLDPTVILHGSPDPHVAMHVADTDCLGGCPDCGYDVDADIHVEWANYLAEALNYAVEHGFTKAIPQRREVTT